MKSFRRRALHWAGKTLPRRIALVTIFVLAVNLGAWVWAFLAFQGRLNLLAIALVVYGLGLRHGVDADHIAAIDNVTRKLMQNGRRPVSVGLYFSLGHSMVVILVSLVVASVTNSLDNFRSWQLAGGTISAIVSSSFLLVIGATNVTIFWSMLTRSRPSHVHSSVLDMDRVRPAQGLLSRLFRPVFQVVEHSWQMLLIGFLFGLGFDTATEVTMFAISATQAAKTASLSAVLIFSVLFAAGMSLLDTGDSLLMLGAYDWASINPDRKRQYNLAVTLVSAGVAIVIGTIEAAGLIVERLRLSGGLPHAIDTLENHMNEIGVSIVILAAAAWFLSVCACRVSGGRVYTRCHDTGAIAPQAATKSAVSFRRGKTG